jgi:hypothetical protein
MEILFTHPIRMFQQYSKNALGMLIISELDVIFYSPHSPKNGLECVEWAKCSENGN